MFYRFKMFLIFLVIVSLVYADEISDCKCNTGYVPETDASGEVYCRGTSIKSLLPCNIVLKPDCKCHEEATTVVQDSSGD